jgi:hypothetical protein
LNSSRVTVFLVSDMTTTMPSSSRQIKRAVGGHTIIRRHLQG